MALSTRTFGMALCLLPGAGLAEVSLQDAFAACEASVVQNSNIPLERIGTVIDQNERGQRIRVQTSAGSVVATVFPPPFDTVAGCILWGSHPEFETEFRNQWRDWVDWNEAEAAASDWFENSLGVVGSADLTDRSHPGFVVARCDVPPNGIVLANQPAVTGVVRQVLPKPSPKPTPRTFFQFSVMRALPGRCKAAVKAFQNKR